MIGPQAVIGEEVIMICGRIRSGIVVALMTGVVVLHAGRSYESVVSFVQLGSNPTRTDDDCSCSPANPCLVGMRTGIDRQTWPSTGVYECPGGRHGFLEANPNPVVASGGVACV
jgi:hypothetical protein